MPNSDAVKVARCVQGWARARCNEWKGRLEREEARKNEAAREAEEEEKAREAREAAATRDRVDVRVGSSGREVELETQGGVGEVRGDDGRWRWQRKRQRRWRGRYLPCLKPLQPRTGGVQILEKKMEATKEKTAVAVAEVPGIQLGVAWDARDLSQADSLFW
jgi:hypothetical protein